MLLNPFTVLLNNNDVGQITAENSLSSAVIFITLYHILHYLREVIQAAHQKNNINRDPIERVNLLVHCTSS